jgi:hypothetical protein
VGGSYPLPRAVHPRIQVICALNPGNFAGIGGWRGSARHPPTVERGRSTSKIRWIPATRGRGTVSPPWQPPEGETEIGQRGPAPSSRKHSPKSVSPDLLIPFAQPCRHELSEVVRRLPGCLQDPPQSGGGGVSVRTTSRRPLPPPDCGSPVATARRDLQSMRAAMVGRREENLERGERASAHCTPRGRSRGGVDVRWFERRFLPDSGRGRTSTDPARNAFTGCGAVIG